MRVLLVEDDSAIARSIELMLKSENFNVYTTELGEEGIRLPGAPDRQGVPDAGAPLAAQGHHADQGDVPQPSLWRHGRARAEDHRRLHLQAAQEAGERLPGQELHRDRLGPRLRAARAG